MLSITIQDKTTVLSEETLQQLKSLDLVSLGNKNFNLIQNNESFNISILQYDKEEKIMTTRVNGKVAQIKVQDKFDLLLKELGMSDAKGAKVNHIKAPMPGLIFELAVAEGDQVKKGDKVLILEAMKMENVIKAAGDGTVKKIHINKGQAVEKNQLLIEFQ
jgi:biotin carboxyl carrier protein